MVYLERIDAHSRLDFSSLPNQLDASILCQDTSISMYVYLVSRISFG